ncbi:hypothetical protein ACFL1B_01205 [Nanoarchaeota archaeon]
MTGRSNKYKKMDKMKYFAVFLLTIIIFSAGVLLGNYLTSMKLDKLTDIEANLYLDTLGAEVQYQILIGDPCQFVNSTPLAEDLYELSEKLDYLEGVFGEDNENVMRLKEQYSLLEVRHWLYVKKTNKECNTSNIPVLYFYSNEGDCPKCEQQGYILTYLRKKFPDLRIYSFDITIDNTAVNTIKKIYDVKTAPTIILGTLVYEEFRSREELEEALLVRLDI